MDGPLWGPLRQSERARRGSGYAGIRSAVSQRTRSRGLRKDQDRDPEQIDDLAEYVLQISGQQADPAKAARGKTLFLDNATGNCFDCHTEEATGNPALGSTNLTRKELFLFGSDKASIVETITKGRRAVMPAFEGTLKPEELKAVSVYVFDQAAKPVEPGR